MKSLFFATFLLFSLTASAQKATVVLCDPCALGQNQGIALKSPSVCLQLPFQGLEACRKVRSGEFQIELNLTDGFIVVDDCGDQVIQGSEIFLAPDQTICFEIKKSEIND